MMDATGIILSIIIGYLVGAIPISRLFGRAMGRAEELETIELPVPGTDETYKVTAMGAAAASMRFGGKIGCLIGILDILKVALPTLILRLAVPQQPYFLIAAVAGMIGHNWPVFGGFKGGRGVSSAYGGFLVVDFIGAIVCALGGMIIGLFVVRDFVFAYLAGIFLAIPWLWVRTQDAAYILFAVALNILFVVAMIPDLRQYLKFRKMGKADMGTVMSMMPMGRGMLKMMSWFGVQPRSAGQAEQGENDEPKTS